MKLQKIYTDVVKLYFRRGPEDGTRKVFIQKKYAGWLDKADKIFVHERLKVIKVIDGRRMAIISGLRKIGE